MAAIIRQNAIFAWMKLITEIPLRRSKVRLTHADSIVTLGSCFSDNMAGHLRDGGFNILANPFGTLYNPESIAAAVDRLDSGEPFSEADCVLMGAGSDLVCSFAHHTSFARKTVPEFLENANRVLLESTAYWKSCDRVIISYGTARVWKHGGRTVSNCLKRPAGEFTRELLTLDRIAEISRDIALRHPDKQFIFTVSPIRYLSDGAEANTISKSLLHLGIQEALKSPGADYFPAWELMMDELRDYRFYAADLVHPRDIAVDYLWEKFLLFCIPKEEHEAVRAAEKAARRTRHRPINHTD